VSCISRDIVNCTRYLGAASSPPGVTSMELGPAPAQVRSSITTTRDISSSE
jgi:hypothetical protein